MILSQVPPQLVAGDTWRWERSFSDYPAPTWTVTYYFENAAGQITAVASASGSQHLVSVPAATTQGYAAGRYRWVARASDGTTVETIEGENGWIDILVNPAAAGNKDHRSWARRTLDAVEATIEGRASNDQLAMSIGSRSISRIPLNELWQLKKNLEAEVRTEEAASAAGLGRNIKVRLTRP